MALQIRRAVALLATLSMVAIMLSTSIAGAEATLTVGFYKRSCPNAEGVIFAAMKQAFKKDKTVAPGVLRLFFHDCFVRGCDASVLIAGPATERASPLNTNLHGFEALDQAKAALEKCCPGVVSCADVLAFAARDTVILTGGKGWAVEAGRRDGRVSLVSEPLLNLPRADQRAAQLIDNFAAKGLTAEQMVDLSGSHTIGISHCSPHMNDRLHGPLGPDPTIPKPFLRFLQKKCPTPVSFAVPLNMDLVTPQRFDSQYFINIKNRLGLMTSDQSLIDDARTRPTVLKNLDNRVFGDRFGRAMVAMGRISPLTGTNGEIRRRCQFVN